MNGNDSFEERMRRVPRREIPSEWRREILGAARPRDTGAPTWIGALFWPHPAAWAGVAAAWLLVLYLNVAARDSAPSPQMQAMLREQGRLLGELTGGPEERPPAQKTPSLPQPRSQRREDFACV
jgi:hypothetical protein